MISLIVCMGKNKVIGYNNKMPWHLPSDLSYFRRATTGKTVLMGRKTFESIGKALPNRRNIILTNDSNFNAPGCEIMCSMEEVMAEFGRSQDELFIIGGAQIYNLFIPAADKLYITKINKSFNGDTFFPNVDLSGWQEEFKADGTKDEKNAYEHTFHVYVHK